MVRNKPNQDGQLLYSDAHDEIFGTGWEHTVYTKCMLIHIEKKMRAMWKRNDGTYKYRMERPNKVDVLQKDGTTRESEKFEDFFKQFFKEATGFGLTHTQSFAKQVKKNNGCLQPREKKGREKVRLEEEFSELPKWMEEQVERASRGSYLTIERLMKKFKEDFIKAPCEGPLQEGEEVVQPVRSMPGKHTFRRALHNMGFTYMKRRVKRLEARESPPVLAQLDDFTQFTVDNHIYRPSKYQPNKMVYSYQPGVEVGSGDESYGDSTEYHDLSWCNAKMTHKDFLKRNSRLVMVHTIFSEKNKKANGDWLVEPAVWSTEWKKKRDNFQYWGKTSAENLEAIYGDALFTLAQDAKADSKYILLLDNYSAHKRIRDELRGTAEDIIDWVNKGNNEEVDDELRQVVHVLQQSAAVRGMQVDKKELYKALTSKGVPLYALEVLAKRYNNMEVKYLPPYYSELNPIELLWAEVKRFYRMDTDPKDDWDKRMEKAWESITPAFIESCFDRSIRWAIKKHHERQEEKKKAAAAAAEPERQEADDEMEEDDQRYEELLAEEAIAEMDEFPEDDEFFEERSKQLGARQEQENDANDNTSGPSAEDIARMKRMFGGDSTGTNDMGDR